MDEVLVIEVGNLLPFDTQNPEELSYHWDMAECSGRRLSAARSNISMFWLDPHG
jgi:hypothetical protein